MLVSGCLGGFETRQVVTGNNFGIVFGGRIEAAEFVRNVDFESQTGGVLGTSIGNFLGAHSSQYDSTLEVEYAIDLLGSLTGAAFDQADRSFRQLQCLYFVRLDSDEIYDEIRAQVLPAPSVGNLEVENSVQDTPVSSVKTSNVVSLPQSCDPSLKVGEAVMLTLSQTGGTIHSTKF